MLYKAKIGLTNFLIKMVIRRFAGRAQEEVLGSVHGGVGHRVDRRIGPERPGGLEHHVGVGEVGEEGARAV